MEERQMPLFLVTSLFDEGIYESDFQIIEAESPRAIAQHMLEQPQAWENYLRSAYPSNWQDRHFQVGSLLDCVQDPEMTPERLLELIDMTSVDGDSSSQLRIFEAQVQSLATVDTNPFKGKTIPIVRLG
jgi:hypothetical protein